jgi:hypothetical protein
VFRFLSPTGGEGKAEIPPPVRRERGTRLTRVGWLETKGERNDRKASWNNLSIEAVGVMGEFRAHSGDPE